MDKDKRIEELKSELALLSPDTDKKAISALKRRITHLERYGVEYPMKNKDIVNKMVSTNLELYGRKNGRGFGSKYSYKTMIEKYGSKGSYGSEELRSKIENTMKERYNVDNPTKSSNVRAKSRNTCRIRYGVDNPSKSPIIKRKKQETRRKHK